MRESAASTLIKEVDQIKSEMQQAVITGLCEVSVKETLVPEVNSEDVLLKLEAVGVCGSDIHYYKHGRIGERKVIYPHVQGHECSGTIVAKGNNVFEFEIGDKVVIEPSISCLKCNYCKKGNYNLCSEMKFISTPPYQGAFSTFITHPASFVHKIPEDLNFTLASLAEPLSVGVHVMNRASVTPGKTLVIIGMGSVGLLTILAAKAYGINKIITSDIVDFKLTLAKQFGASDVINATTENLEQTVRKYTNNQGADVIIETSGNGGMIKNSSKLLKAGGKVVLVGFPSMEDIPFNFIPLLQKEIDIITIYRYKNTFPLAIEILTRFKKIAEKLITHKFELNDIELAMKQVLEHPSETVKVVVYPNGIK